MQVGGAFREPQRGSTPEPSVAKRTLVNREMAQQPRRRLHTIWLQSHCGTSLRFDTDGAQFPACASRRWDLEFNRVAVVLPLVAGFSTTHL
ncbi:MAG: hypothetical protein CMO80_01940 [Verrucomicrobiales bacterium]|nr:hypothetical protein [Verrucomicrobiales bacterium]